MNPPAAAPANPPSKAPPAPEPGEVNASPEIRNKARIYPTVLELIVNIS